MPTCRGMQTSLVGMSGSRFGRHTSDSRLPWSEAALHHALHLRGANPFSKHAQAPVWQTQVSHPPFSTWHARPFSNHQC
eukprot:1160090-Pelagomonas_calceolata.AAC.15